MKVETMLARFITILLLAVPPGPILPAQDRFRRMSLRFVLSIVNFVVLPLVNGFVRDES
jgi:hypothetical protein